MSDREFFISGKLELSDFKDFFKNSKLAKIFKKIAICMSCVWLAAVILFAIFFSPIGMIICALGIVITLAAFLSYPMFAAQSTYSMLAAGLVDLDYTVMIKNKVITTTMNKNESAIPYSDVQEVIDADGKILVYNSSFTGIIINKSDLQEDEIEQLLALLNNWTQRK